MKCVILAGGIGSRLMEETETKPKPMVEIGDSPILWHIMKIYSHYGINDFVVCLGYKGYMIKEFFLNYYEKISDITVDLSNNSVEICKNQSEPWRVTLVDTGSESLTATRLSAINPYLDDDDFCFTYGDGLANVAIPKLIENHKKSKCLATVTAVQPPGRFGVLNFENSRIVSFREKPLSNQSWINGGFFVLSPQALEYIGEGNISWEKEPMEALATDNELNVHFHEGFWQCMDTLRDKVYLDNLWRENKAPWKIWQDHLSEVQPACV